MQEEKQPIMQHIAAFRKVIISSAVGILVAFIFCFYFFGDSLVDFLSAPIRQRGIQIIYTAVSEALLTKLKVSLIAGIVLASPYVIFKFWGFISPALYPNERKRFGSLMLVILLLFCLGIVFCYAVVYSLALDFFLVAGEGLATPMLSIDNYVGYLFSFALPFGIAFQVPVIIYMTTSLGVTTGEGLVKARKFVIFAIFVIAAVLTPPDVVSQVLMAFPMLVLYEVSIIVARKVKPRRDRRKETVNDN